MNNFYVEHFFIRVHLEGQITCATQVVIRATHQTGCLVGRATFGSWEGCIRMAVTFAYELRLGRFLYQNRPFRRDEELCSYNLFHQRPSWGRNQPNTVLNTKSQYFEYNFGLRDEIGWLWPKYQLCFWPCQNLVPTHAPLFFGKTCVPKNNLHEVCSKRDVNTPSAILYVLWTISIYRTFRLATKVKLIEHIMIW